MTEKSIIMRDNSFNKIWFVGYFEWIEIFTFCTFFFTKPIIKKVNSRYEAW